MPWEAKLQQRADYPGIIARIQHRPTGEPGVIEVPRVVEVMLNQLKELDRLAFHDRARRRSKSGRVIRFTLPVL